jgi:hypothetical protein
MDPGFVTEFCDCIRADILTFLQFKIFIMLHQIGVYFHMLAILLVGAGGIGGAIVEHHLWKKISTKDGGSKVIMPILKSTGMFIMAGIVIFLLSGMLMLYSVHWVYLSQPWFIVKFVLFLCLPVRAALIAKPSLTRIGIESQKDQSDSMLLLKLKSKMNRFHIIQYGIVLVIIFLVIFKV